MRPPLQGVITGGKFSNYVFDWNFFAWNLCEKMFANHVMDISTLMSNFISQLASRFNTDRFPNRSDVRDYKMPRRKTTRRSRRKPKDEGGEDGKEGGGGDGEGGGGGGGGEGGGRVGGDECVASPNGEGRVQGGGGEFKVTPKVKLYISDRR